jgi:hypothetical protein
MDIFLKEAKKKIGLYCTAFPISTLLCAYTFIFILIIYTVSLATYKNTYNDFSQEYNAAHAYLSGETIYGPPTVRADALQNKNSIVRITDNFHPPFNTFLFIPFTLLSPSSAYTLYFFVILGICCFILNSTRKYMQNLITNKNSLSRIHEVSLLCICFWTWYPVYTSCIYANIGILITFAVFCYGNAVIFSRDKLNAPLQSVLLGCACLMKLYPLLFLPLCILLRRYKDTFVIFSTFLIGHLVCFIFLGKDDTLKYYIDVAKNNIDFYGAHPGNHSLTGLIMPVFQQNDWIYPLFDATAIGKIFIALTCLIFFIFYIRSIKTCVSSYEAGLLKRSIEEKSPEIPFYLPHFCCIALTAVATLLFSPITWDHGLLLAIPALCLLYKNSSKVCLLVIVIFGVPNVIFYSTLHTKFSSTEKTAFIEAIFVKGKTFALVYLFLYCIYIIRRDLHKLC